MATEAFSAGAVVAVAFGGWVASKAVAVLFAAIGVPEAGVFSLSEHAVKQRHNARSVMRDK